LNRLLESEQYAARTVRNAAVAQTPAKTGCPRKEAR
jgi:hypothetical protein